MSRETHSMTNQNHQLVRERRKDVMECLSHHVDRPSLIKTELSKAWPQITIDQVVNDVRVIKQSTNSWLVGLAKTGYIYDVMLGVKKIKEHEAILNEMLEEEPDLKVKREIMKQIDELIITRLSLEGEGPVFLAITSRK